MLRSGSLARFSVLVAAVGLAGAALSPQAAVAGRAAAGPSLDWPQYLHDPQHSSVSAATAFTPLTAASARVVWHWQPPVIAGKQAPFMFASPTVAVGRVYIGTLSGEFYALNEATGAVLWSRLLDTEPKTACGARGIISTAAVQPDPVTGTNTVYVSGARYLYALNAATGAMDWKTEIGAPGATSADAYYNWSSPTVVDGHIYVGLSSNCDDPLIRGGVVELDQHTGRVLNTWYSVPAGSIGGSVWSSVAASPDGQDVWASTGSECDPKINTCPPKDQVGHALSIVHLSSSLAQLQTWQAPCDWPRLGLRVVAHPVRQRPGGGRRVQQGRGVRTTRWLLTRLVVRRGGPTSSARRRARRVCAWPARSGTARPVRSTSPATARPSAPPSTGIGPPGQPANRCLPVADRPALRGDGYAVAGQRGRHRCRHLRVPGVRNPGRVTYQRHDRHRPEDPARLRPHLRPAGIRPEQPVRRHRDTRALRIRALIRVLRGGN